MQGTSHCLFPESSYCELFFSTPDDSVGNDMGGYFWNNQLCHFSPQSCPGALTSCFRIRVPGIYTLFYVCESESESCKPIVYTVHGILQPNTGVGSLSLLQRIFPTQGSNPGLPHCGQILYQLSHKEAKNIGVGSLSPLQWIFPTQESNRGLLHCRWTLYKLSY